MAFITPTSLLLVTLSITIITVTALPQNDVVGQPEDFLDAHNQARAAVGVQPLVWDDAVAQYAAGYASQRYGDCRLEHSRGPYGENLAEGWGRLSGTEAVGMWVGERSSYDHASNTCVGGECRHYTQVVWNESIRLGCGGVRCRNGWVFVICNYDPPGNYIGERPY